jgi:radical SAM superfamily enzyme YgiQ (UPF0313 family)
MKHPSENINCLMVYPKFSQFSFWNTREAVALVGAKAPAPPLGLITVAALLPQNWNFRLVDLNTSDLSEADWEWADMVCGGGMLPQQAGLLALIDECNERKKFVAVGGPDPSSQPNIYEDADALVMGEGEVTIPMWLESWEAGKPAGTFNSPEKPDMTESPVPRFDLLKMQDYFCMGVQYARGCPFNCEFCDIIELYGRKPRQKSPPQILKELETLYDMGYRGYVEIVDDNFIGNKRHVKRELLPALISWNKRRKKPFYFGVEASMNIGDDEKLLTMMELANFRYAFMGIETPDPDLLKMTQKSQNTMRSIEERVHNVVNHGIIVTAGFIIGFDGEKPGTDLSIIKCIEDSAICMAMMGMLVALPNTQLTRRLVKEGRLMDFSGNLIDDPKKMMNRARVKDIKVEALDQTVAGLNYVPTRHRQEIVDELVNIVRTVYSPKSYFERVLRTVKLMRYRKPRVQSWYEIKRNIPGFFKLCWKMTLNKTTRWLFWKTSFQALLLGGFRFEIAQNLFGTYVHFEKHTKALVKILESQRGAYKGVIMDMKELESKWESGEITPPESRTPAPRKTQEPTLTA